MCEARKCQTVMVTVRLCPAMLAELDRTAAEIGVSRSDLIKARLRKAAIEDRQGVK